MNSIKKMFSKEPSKITDASELSVYMDPIEHSQLRAVVETLAPKTVLEWGCGGSTKAFLDNYPFIEKLVSVEQNEAWYNIVKGMISDDRLEFFLELPAINEPDMFKEKDAYWAWADQCEEDSTILTNYVAVPATLNISFDLVFVDGRSRIHCLKQGWELLNPNGILMLHDAQREVYQETLSQLGRPVFLEPWVNGQICLIRKDSAK